MTEDERQAKLLELANKRVEAAVEATWPVVRSWWDDQWSSPKSHPVGLELLTGARKRNI